MKNQVKWERLLPKEFQARQQKKSLVYLPMGICEPHGHIAPFGLDTLKAEYLCNEAATQFGGIVAPTLGYQIHESGYHARWLQDVVGEVNPFMTGMPPELMLKFFLYQLRTFTNAGFQAIFALTGHAGGNEKDYRLLAAYFQKQTNVKVLVKADPELVEGKFQGDHAGKYEISQLLYLHPELMAMERLKEEKTNLLGQFAQGEDANQASAEMGEEIIEESLKTMKKLVSEIQFDKDRSVKKLLSYEETESIWEDFLKSKSQWVTTKPAKGQQPVSKDSQWLPFEKI